jgi:GH24 family phage-related lysozyme (muramidase)
MNIDKLREEIAYDEGSVNEIYLDHLGLPTFGIGHLVLDSDPEYGYEVGTPVSQDRCNSAFDSDVQTVLSDCERLYPDFDDLPEEVQLIVANMMFQHGSSKIEQVQRYETWSRLKRLELSRR